MKDSLQEINYISWTLGRTCQQAFHQSHQEGVKLEQHEEDDKNSQPHALLGLGPTMQETRKTQDIHQNL